MASSNPFRRKPTTATPLGADRFPPLDTIDISGTPLPRTSFRESTSPPEAPAGDKKTKPVKKVRVLSPPPLSPDSPEWPFSAPLSSVADAQAQASTDPFEGASTDDSDYEGAIAPPNAQASSRIPANPFSKTIQHVNDSMRDDELQKERHEEGAALKAGNKAKGSLDVSSFQQLLMAGIDSSTGSSSPSSVQPSTPGDRGSAESPFSHDGLRDSRTPRYGQPQSQNTREDDEAGVMSDSSTSVQFPRGKKPPPPPSSRHGKSIKVSPKHEHAIDIPRVRSPTDTNKSLPPAPLHRSFEDVESPFDRAYVGKTPEVVAPTGGKKSVPAPPPRRGHARASSKALKSSDNDPPSRSSMDSVRSASDSIRNSLHGPAPPPPRRLQTTGSRQSSHMSSPSVGSFSAAHKSPSSPSPDPEVASPSAYFAPPVDSRDVHNGGTKLSGPPPPPTRNLSFRRPASIQSVDSISRRVSGDSRHHNGTAPPPPPRRQRGNSRGSVDGPARRTSTDSVSKPSPSPNEPGPSTVVGTEPSQDVESPGKGVDILADLDALQREVDALMGKTK